MCIRDRFYTMHTRLFDYGGLRLSRLGRGHAPRIWLLRLCPFRPLEPSAKRVALVGNLLRATSYAASQPKQKKRTIHVLQNRTILKTRDIRQGIRPSKDSGRRDRTQ